MKTLLTFVSPFLLFALSLDASPTVLRLSDNDYEKYGLKIEVKDPEWQFDGTKLLQVTWSPDKTKFDHKSNEFLTILVHEGAIPPDSDFTPPILSWSTNLSDEGVATSSFSYNPKSGTTVRICFGTRSRLFCINLTDHLKSIPEKPAVHRFSGTTVEEFFEEPKPSKPNKSQ